MADLDPSYVYSLIDHFAPRVAAEMKGIEAEMKAAFPGCSIHKPIHDGAWYVEYPHFWERGEVPLAFVKCRLVSGQVHSGTVWVGLGTGEVWLTGWPLEAGSGWVRG